MAGCVRHTVEDAIAEGFRPIVVRECVGDRVPAPWSGTSSTSTRSSATSSRWSACSTISKASRPGTRLSRRARTCGCDERRELAQQEDAHPGPYGHDRPPHSGRVQRLRRARFPHARARARVMEPKGHIVLDRYAGEWEVMPSYIEGAPRLPRASGSRSGRTTRSSTCRPSSRSSSTRTPESGFPLAICDGSHHDDAAGASAARSPQSGSRKDSRVLAIVGAGTVGRARLQPQRGLPLE